MDEDEKCPGSASGEPHFYGPMGSVRDVETGIEVEERACMLCGKRQVRARQMADNQWSGWQDIK